jgi:serine/threonine-protein kinase RsbT
VPDETRVPINSEIDIISARQKGRALAEQIGFSSSEQAVIATAISELARNIVDHAGGRGEIILSIVQDAEKKGIVITARDNGPGIADIKLAMQDGYSTKKGLGLGLPGAKRLMDELEINSEVGKGTTVLIRKWRR